MLHFMTCERGLQILITMTKVRKSIAKSTSLVFGNASYEVTWLWMLDYGDKNLARITSRRQVG
jgi:hypothetical protein